MTILYSTHIIISTAHQKLVGCQKKFARSIEAIEILSRLDHYFQISFNRRLVVPDWHKFPVNPPRQVQVKVLTPLTHVPPFWHWVPQLLITTLIARRRPCITIRIFLCNYMNNFIGESYNYFTGLTATARVPSDTVARVGIDTVCTPCPIGAWTTGTVVDHWTETYR